MALVLGFSEPLTLKQLANYTQISPVYLSSLIKKETNMSLSEHINLVRIDESKKRLIYSNMSIQDIAKKWEVIILYDM